MTTLSSNNRVKINALNKEIERIKELNYQTLQQYVATITQLTEKHCVEMTKILEENEELKSQRIVPEMKETELVKCKRQPEAAEESEPICCVRCDEELDEAKGEVLCPRDWEKEEEGVWVLWLD